MLPKFTKSPYLLSCFLLVLVIHHSAGRGGRGSRRSSRYGSGGSPIPGSRYDRFTRYSQATENKWTVSGIDEYRARLHGTKYYDEDPSLCYTDDLTIPNTIVKNIDNWRTHTGYFVCPNNDSNSYTETYCCGDKDKQHCCIFWDDASRKAGGIAGIVLGGLVGVGLIIFAILIGFTVRCQRINQFCNGRSSSQEDSETTEGNIEMNVAEPSAEEALPTYGQLYNKDEKIVEKHH